MSEKQYFTLVFEGDIREFKGNPHKTATAFGVPVAVGVGNAFDEIEALHEKIGASDDVDRMLWGKRARVSDEHAPREGGEE